MKNTKKAKKVKRSIEEYLSTYRINRGGKPSQISMFRKDAEALGVKTGDIYRGLPINVVLS